MFRPILKISLRGKLFISGIAFLLCLGAIFSARTNAAANFSPLEESATVQQCPVVPLKLFNSGVDNGKALLTASVPDGHYSLIAQNGSVAPSVVLAPASGWVTSSAARWISRSGAATAAFRYTTQFELSGCELSSVSIKGQFAASQSGQLFLNNNATPIAQTAANGALSFTTFTITSGFQAGPNTLTFVTAAGAQQTGLLVEFTEATARCCQCQSVTIGTASLPVGNRDQAYEPATLTASGGTAPYTYSVIGSDLPAGLSLSSAGAISGTPTAAGNFVVKVLAVDAMGCTGVRQYDLRIRRRLVFYSTRVIPSSNFSGEQTTSTLSVTVTLTATSLERRWKFSGTPTSVSGSALQSSGLSNPRAFIGPDAASGQLIVNNTQAAQNRLGLEIIMPPGQTVGSGDKHVFTLLYDIAPNAIGSRFGFEFSDDPVSRGIFDVNGNSLPADFSAPQFVLAPSVANVSAASYLGGAVAAEEIVSAFGVKLATATVAASSVPLPTMLAGTTVKVIDSANVERFAPLFFVAPTQINYLIPAGTAPGNATVLVTSGDGTVSGSVVEIAGVAPGIFVADASGRGLPAANALTFRADGSSGSAAVARFDTASNKFVAVPIDLGTITDRVFLSLFATGVRKRTSLDNVRAIIGGAEAPVFFAGDQGGFAGLDQINIEIPRSLAGSGLVDVTLIVDGQIANVVQVNIR
jgi:uncharacterized protein (TIGR03437 family)